MKRLMKHIARKTSNALIGGAITTGICLMSIQLFAYLVPGKYYVNYYKTEAFDSSVGKPVTLNLCRNARQNIKPEAVRSIISTETGKVVGEYEFMPNIQKGDSCSLIDIDVDRHPQLTGEYFITTNLTFVINGVEKQVEFTTNKYQYR